MTFLQRRRKHSLKVKSNLNINIVQINCSDVTAVTFKKNCSPGREIYRNSVPRMYQDGFQFEIRQCMV